MSEVALKETKGRSSRLSDRQKDIIQKFAALGSLVILAIIFSATSPALAPAPAIDPEPIDNGTLPYGATTLPAAHTRG